jgi:carboxyvinyl-carboxyphosphonate phosphorylmutase
MRHTELRLRARAILNGTDCVSPASVYDALSARVAALVGFELGLLSGSISSASTLPAPDTAVITLTEFADQVRRVVRAGDLSLLVDADNGYGNALNVMRTVEELHFAGAAAVMIEDTLLPRPFGAGDAPKLIAIDEAIGKMKAAVRARGDSDLLIFGRTGAATIASIDEAIARFRAFESTGVDALFLPGVRTREELDRIAAAVRLPLIAGGVAEPVADAEYLASRGVRLWSGGHQVFAVAVNALFTAMKSVHDGVYPSRLPGIASNALLDTVTGSTGYRQRTHEFMGGQMKEGHR